MTSYMFQYLQDHLDWLVTQFRSDGQLHECDYHGCTVQTRLRYCEEHHAIQGQFVEKYHIWDKFKNDPSMPKNEVAKTELILRDRYEYLFNMQPDYAHTHWKDFLVTHITADDIEEIMRYARAQNEGRNLPYWEEKLRQKRGGGASAQSRGTATDSD